MRSGTLRRALGFSFIALSMLAVAALLVFRQPAAPLRHVILFVGDGMQLEHEVAASRYLHGRDDGLEWQAFPYQSYVATWDVSTYDNYAEARGQSAYKPEGFRPEIGYDSSLGGSRPSPLANAPSADDYFILPGGRTFATDSASSATALATGHKTDDGNIAWLPGDPEGGSLRTIAERLRADRGFAIGVVSTVPFSHATPASFTSHNVSRSNYHQIADEILFEVKPDVVIGGGHPDFRSNYMSKASLEKLRSSPEWVVVEREPGCEAAGRLMAAAKDASERGRKLFGLFGGTEGNFESPVPADTPGAPSVTPATNENPSLAQATLAALELLGRDAEGFFVLVEQGDVDWANHDHDYGRMIGTISDLDSAVRAAVAFVDREGDDITWENTLLVVTADHANAYMRLDPDVRLGRGDLPVQEGRGKGVKYPGGEVWYGVRGHTNELVTLYARGSRTADFAAREGSWYPCTRILDNTQVFGALAAAAGLDVQPFLKPAVTDAACK